MNIALIGLGNPDAKYHHNRHNVGFMFVDWLHNEFGDWRYDKYVRAEIAKVNLSAISYPLSAILAKPQTYMNNSGESVKKLITNYELPITNCIVVHDDLDMRLGKFKIQMGVGPKKHNGVDSIEHHLKTSEFWRVRIGIDNRVQGVGIQGEAYVLSNFTNEEQEAITDMFPEILERLKMVIE